LEGVQPFPRIVSGKGAPLPKHFSRIDAPLPNVFSGRDVLLGFRDGVSLETQC